MKVARLTQVKNDLSRYVEHVRRGGRVRILVRGVPAADLVPVASPPGDETAEDARLAELERCGVIRRGKGGVPAGILKPGPRARGKPASQLIIKERRGSTR